MKKKKILKIVISIIILIVVLISVIFYFDIDKRISTIGGTEDEWLYDEEMSCDFNGFTAYDCSGAAASSKSIFGGASMTSESTLGYSTGGAKNVENFRKNIENGYFPISTDITYNGLFYDYSFDTGNDSVKSNDLFYPSYSTAISKDIISGEKEYYMSVGLNSNIKESDFSRKKLNLVVVLDNSGSMESGFDSYYYDSNFFKANNKSKMQVANKAVNTLIDQLNKDDRFGMIVFNSEAYIAKNLKSIDDTNVYALKEHILDIKTNGGTNFEAAYKKATELFDDIDQNEYENRIIVITDAMPNIGSTNKSDLMESIEENSKKDIYTTFIGVGVDFNTELIESLGTVSGANYYSVHNEKEFEKQMGEEFNFMVTPLVFDLELNFESEDYELEAIYGTDAADKSSGNIMYVNTLFPSASNEDGEVKGGIILLKLNKITDSKTGKISLSVSYKDKENKKHNSNQVVNFKDSKNEFYDNTGIRKGIVLTRYANLMKNWILYERSDSDNKFLITSDTGIVDCGYDDDFIGRILGEQERSSVKLSVSEEYEELFEKMRLYIQSEIDEVQDKKLEQEIDICKVLENYNK